MRYLNGVATIALALGLAACARTPEPAPEAARAAFTPTSVRIVDIAPTTNDALHPGDKIAFELDIAYTLSTTEGTLGVVVQDAQDKPLAQRFDAVVGHSGRARMTLALQVPETEALRVFAPIAAQGQVGTTVVDMREYRVSAR
jgi:hypothetical protein